MSEKTVDTGWPRTDYCGCCGRPYQGRDSTFCDDCLKHVAPRAFDKAPWDRTFEAVHKAPCPYQVKAGEEE